MKSLINLLKNSGVESIYFCSGSRNSSLEKGLTDNFKLTHCFDERQASFLALGETKITQKPVVVCMTSGSAVLECISALSEAFYSNEKLIILSADRPLRLAGSGAPQTIEQVRPLRPFVKTQINSTLYEIEESLELKYPVQINVQIDDAINSYEKSLKYCGDKEFSEFLKVKRPLFIITHGYDSDLTQRLTKTLLKNNFFVFLEKTANVLIKDEYPNLIFQDKSAQFLLDNNFIDSVVRIGHTPLAKLWRDLDRQYVDVDVFHIDPRSLQAMARGNIWPLSNLKKLIDIVEKYHVVPTEFSELDLWKVIDQFPKSEPAFFYKLSTLINQDDIVFLGNSMPVRYWQMTSCSDAKCLSSRGVNGIDGQVATAIGIASKTTKNVYAILGDLTCLYDLSSLLFQLPNNLKIIVINNFGGRIFEVVGKSGPIINEHNKAIEQLIKGFDINSTSFNDPKHIVLESQLIELFPDVDQTRSFWRNWREL